MNVNLAAQVVQKVLDRGVETFCVCPASRNAPFVTLLEHLKNQVKIYYFFEERSAAFFALGKIRTTGKPVAVVTTSGTAAGELLPAVMEAHYAGLPLILITADRPKCYRGSGSPQTAEQVDLYSNYTLGTLDLEKLDQLQWPDQSSNRPLHINVCFDEPLLDQNPENLNFVIREKPSMSLIESSPLVSLNSHSIQIREFLKKVKNPLVIVGMLMPDERKAALDLLSYLRVPTYFEAASGLRECSQVHGFQIRLANRVIERAFQRDYPIDGIIRIGGVPTLRLWRDLNQKFKDLPVLSLYRLPFSGLGRESILLSAPLEQSCEFLKEILLDQAHLQTSLPSDQFLKEDQHIYFKLQEILKSETDSESGMIARISQLIPAGAKVYLGNSLPIREWDLAATFEQRNLEIWASRGLNGIDGQISTFYGYAESGRENWAILGDLTTLYDLSGPWILPQLKNTRTNLVVINNGGGKIFDRIYSQKVFQNSHDVQFGQWAGLWNIHYECWNSIPDQLSEFSSHRIIEVQPNEEATQRFWKRYDQL